MDEERVSDLEARVAALEREVGTLRKQVFTTTGGPEPAAVVLVKPRHPAPAAPAAPAAVRRSFNAEAFFGGRLLLAVGALAFLIGVGFFLKYAFDNGWIGPTGRVALGILCGAAMIAAGERLLRSSRRAFGEALAGLGAAVVYLALWAAGSYFHLLPLGVTFGAMVFVTAGIMAIALRADAQRLALASLAGGMIAPALNAGPSASLITLFAYLAVLDTGLLWLVARRWPHFEAFAFAATQVWVFVEMPWDGRTLSHDGTVTLVFATVFLLQFAVPAFFRARKMPDARPYEVAITALLPGAFYLELYAQLYTPHRLWLSGATLALAAAYLYAARATRGRLRETAASIALTLVTIGVGITLTGASQAAAWSVEAAALVLAGARMSSFVIRLLGYFTFLCSFGTMESGLTAGMLFANPRFATLIVTALAFGAIAGGVRGRSEEIRPERYVSEVSEAFAHLFVLLAAGFELDAAFRHALLPISLLMLAYAAALVAAGFAFKRVFTRWEGLILFAALIVKVFFVDMASVDTVVRIVSFLAVGGVLLIVAFLYQRAQGRVGESV